MPKMEKEILSRKINTAKMIQQPLEAIGKIEIGPDFTVRFGRSSFGHH